MSAPKNPKPEWQQTPEWKKTVEKVKACERAGLTLDNILSVTGLERTAVQRIVEDEDIAKELAKENFQKKLPVMKDILGMGLEVMHQTMADMLKPEVRAQMITKMGDLGVLSKVLSDMHQMMRLEQGQATEISASVSHNYNETRMVLNKLRTEDPVFDYPELPEKV